MGKSVIGKYIMGRIEDRTDHKGVVFYSTRLMCEHWGMKEGVEVYLNRIRDGWSKEVALTTKVGTKREEDRTDHTGRVFGTTRSMCEHFGIDIKLYQQRRRVGWSKREALTREKVIHNESLRTDHTGRVFSTIKEMCRHWNVEYYKYNERIKIGWSKEKALTTVDEYRNIGAIEDRTDHTRRVFDSIGKMCKHWGVSHVTYNNRIKSGLSKEEALTKTSGKTYKQSCIV